MRFRILLMFLSLPVLQGTPAGPASRVERRSYVLAETGERLEYAVFVSSKADRAKKSPLVIVLHGAGTPPARWLPRIADAAEEAGYILAAPMGYDVEGWFGANGPASGRRARLNIGELSEKDVMNVLALARNEFNIDDRRIYLYGHSMGGAGALYLGIKHQDIWAAVGASAPAVRALLHTPAELERAVDMPMILLHGNADRDVPVTISRAWAAKMHDLQMKYEYREFPRTGHADVVQKGAPLLFAFFDRFTRPTS